MPTETRQLVFTDDEVTAALAAHNRMSQSRLFVGRIVSCRVRPGDDPAVDLTLRHETTGGTYQLAFGADVVGPALIRYCLEINIPLPRRGRKGFLTVQGRIAMTVTLEPHADPVC
ncbi:hypothetical protein SAE02_75810 [Skermanella aerolata]|uniref:Uncharacterized protein n=1 Tax=Skermanella aerolata TaxID=393310 RepID=A0A512E3W8_9PROT|nr:hypothetical protein [Skermanella aerolata]KJB90570.1 hypothetical protein N826_38940 [Skermanella aerolata KACC 11604]GEO43433.1 hypothetical protein SAE02_75810 [Skermanella aerolata]